MKLKQLLKEAKGNIKLGSKNGFFYCGSVDYFNENAVYISAEIKKAWESFGDKLTTKVAAAKNYTWYDYLAEEARKYNKKGTDPDFSKEGFEKKRKRIDKKAMTDLNNAVFYYSKARHFISLPNREVVDAYESAEDNTMIIILEGDEHGRFWTVEEEEHWRELKSKSYRICGFTASKTPDDGRVEKEAV